jgi:MFS family permease
MSRTESPLEAPLNGPAEAAAIAEPAPTQADAFAALRFPEFRNLMAGTFLFTIALLIQEVVISYELYRLTHDPLVLGLIGLAEAVPFISLALFGGHVADRRDKRKIMLVTMGFIILASAVLLWVMRPAVHETISRTTLLTIIYGVIAALGLARGFLTPATGALKAFLVPREHYPNSSAWSSTAWQAGAILGPASGGFLYAGFGLTATLGIVLVLLVLTLLLFMRIRPRPVVVDPAVPAESLWTSLREGIRFVFGNRIILYSISLDLFSVLFGGVVAILPVFAEDVLHVGAQGLGVLRAAPAVGAMLTVLACTRFPPTRNAWRNLLIAVGGFGVAILAFGLSRNFWLSAAALFASGAFDSISVVIRGTILQVMPPDHLRGRVLAVNSIFISSSNEIGAFQAGLSAHIFGATRSVLIGGSITLMIVGYVWRKSKTLFDVRLA